MTSTPRTGVAAASLLAAVVWARNEPTECPYFTAMPSYVLESSDDEDFDMHPFFDGHAVVTVEGKLYSKYYALKEGAPQASELQIIRNYANALRAIGGVVFIEGAASPPSAAITKAGSSCQARRVGTARRSGSNWCRTTAGRTTR